MQARFGNGLKWRRGDSSRQLNLVAPSSELRQFSRTTAVQGLRLEGVGPSCHRVYGRHLKFDRVAEQITEKFAKLAIRRGVRLDKDSDDVVQLMRVPFSHRQRGRPSR